MDDDDDDDNDDEDNDDEDDDDDGLSVRQSAFPLEKFPIVVFIDF